MSPSDDRNAPVSAQPTSTPSVEPLSDDQSRAQVVDPAIEITIVASLRVTYATFAWEWCNDQGDPPYHGRIDVTFEVPAGTADPGAFFDQIAQAAAKLPGWAAGPPPGLRPFGSLAHKGGVMAVVGATSYPDRGSLQLFGECRNMSDHREDSGPQDITDQFRSG